MVHPLPQAGPSPESAFILPGPEASKDGDGLPGEPLPLLHGPPGEEIYLKIQCFGCLSVPNLQKHTSPMRGNGLFWPIHMI